MSKSQLDKQLLEIFRKYVIPFQWTSNRWLNDLEQGLVHLIAPCCWGQLEYDALTDVLGRHKGTDSLSHSPDYGHQPLSLPEQGEPFHSYSRQKSTCQQ